MAGSVGNADCKEERTARVIIDRRGIARYFFPRSSEQGAWPPGVKSETFMRGWRRIGEYILPRTRTCLPACLPFSPARDPTDLRKHALIYGGFHPSVVVGILTIYENPPPPHSWEIRLVLADHSSIFSLSDLQRLPRSVYNDSRSKANLGTRLLLLDPCCRRLERYAVSKTSLRSRGNIFSCIFFFYFSLSAAGEIGFYDFAIA